MMPIGPGADGVMTFKMAGMFAETFDNLQVSSIRIHSSSIVIIVKIPIILLIYTVTFRVL